jgi:EAL and modified HD-GYP domain-containing signal transduction protein
MHISQEVKEALLEDKGTLGEIYALVRAIEAFDTQAIANYEERHGLEANMLKDVVLESMKRVTEFENPSIAAE